MVEVSGVEGKRWGDTGAERTWRLAVRLDWPVCRKRQMA